MREIKSAKKKRSDPKVIANVSTETKSLLDQTSEKTGVKKGKIIENGIMLECERLKNLFDKQ
jgi:hypothetical protein